MSHYQDETVMVTNFTLQRNGRKKSLGFFFLFWLTKKRICIFTMKTSTKLMLLLLL